MQRTKESELVAAILMYAMRCVLEGDRIALRDTQFGDQELEAIAKLSLLDLQRLESVKAHCLNIKLNQQVFWPIIEHLRRERDEEHTIQELLKANAPLEMMHTLYGMSARDFTGRRKKLVLETGVGRPPLPDTDAETELYNEWSRLVRTLGHDDLDGKHYMKLHRTTQQSLRVIWQLTQRWRDFPQV